MESLTPNIFVRDMERSITFYETLGFQLTMHVPDEKPYVWAMLSCGSVSMMIQSFESLGTELPEIDRTQNGGSLLMYIRTTGIRAFFESIKNKVEVVKGLEKTFYGATEFTVKDADGFLLTFAEDE